AASRLRVVLMTALLAILGLMPAALSSGVGSETQRPFAVVIIGGLVTAVAVTLLELPAVYAFIVRKAPVRASDEDPVWEAGEATHREAQRCCCRRSRLSHRELRRRGRGSGRAASRARDATTLAGRRREVRQAFATLVARQEELRILQDSQAELQRIAHVVRGRAEAGDSSQYDVLRIDIESRTLQVEVMNAATDVEDAS